MRQLEFTRCPVCDCLLTEEQMCQDTNGCIYYAHAHSEQYYEEMPLAEVDDEDNQPKAW